MIKLVACDLDGTLFNSEMEVSKENITAIHQAQKSGIEFLVATGRAPRESKVLLKKFNIETGYINLNGGLVYDRAGNLMVKNPINKEKAKQIFTLLHQENFYFEVLTQDHIYTENLHARIANIARLMVDLNGISFKQAVAISAGNKSIMNMTQIEDCMSLIHYPEEIFKIMVFDSRGPVAFSQLKPTIEKLGDLVITSSSASNIEINNYHAQKGLALLDYAHKKGIAVQEVAAIGDNLNDLNMIKLAGTGVAMGNAIPIIKENAQVITKTNNENGVAYILKQFITQNSEQR